MLLLLLACHTDAADSPGPADADTDTDADSDTDTDADTDTADSDTSDTDTAPVPCDPGDPDACGEGEACCTPCCEEGAAAVCTPLDAFGGCPLPDLSVDAGRFEGSLLLEDQTFEETDCAVVEGCVAGPGLRRLLRFTTSTPNLGTGDLYLGRPEEHPDQFSWSECHQHYHYEGYAGYALLDSSGAAVVTGRKQAFCLMDSEPVTATGLPVYDCGNQGISVGWADNYGASLDCQWLDVTGVAAGDYTMQITIDPEGQLREVNAGNNSVAVTVSLPDPAEPPVCAP